MTDIRLTEKERKFIELKSKGLKRWQIATQLLTSPRYVDQLASDLYQKTGTSNGSSLVRWAFEKGHLKINAEILPTEERKTG